LYHYQAHSNWLAFLSDWYIGEKINIHPRMSRPSTDLLKRGLNNKTIYVRFLCAMTLLFDFCVLGTCFNQGCFPGLDVKLLYIITELKNLSATSINISKVCLGALKDLLQ
jgi:hypothetical protein